jgi:hypothetical protein
MSSSFLQIFLLINVFVIGGLTALAIQHAYAHFKPHTHDAEKAHPANHPVQLPPAVKARLLAAAEHNFQTVLDRSASQLEHNLQATTGQLDKQLEKLGSEILNDEMRRYREAMDELRARTEISIGSAQTEITQHQDDLKAKLAERRAELEAQLTADMTAEKQRLTQQIDTKLADAVASFLLETLQHNVDLGAQSTYLTTMLDEHKEELTRGVTDEA